MTRHSMNPSNALAIVIHTPLAANMEALGCKRLTIPDYVSYFHAKHWEIRIIHNLYILLNRSKFATFTLVQKQDPI